MKTSVWILVLFTLFACSNQKDSNKAQTLEIIETEKPLIKLPKNIILMIGDGMGISQITAGMYANGNKLNLERCKVIGLIKTNSEDDLIFILSIF